MRKVLLLLLVMMLAMAACGDDSDGDNGSSNGSDNGSNNDDDDNESQGQADLAISDIQVFPSSPIAGQPFTLNVYVRNDGDSESGQYEVAISIEDVDNGGTYPVGTEMHAPMQSGEDYLIYGSTDRLVNSAGTHRVVVEIIPFDFTDPNESNNTQVYDFVVIN